MDFLSLVNRVLAMCKQTYISAISSTEGTDAFNVQTCVNDCIADLANLLRIKRRIVNFEITTADGTRTYNVPKRVIFPFISLRQKDTDLRLTQLTTEEMDRIIPDDSADSMGKGDPAYYYIESYHGVQNQPASTGETVYAVSDSASDNGIVVLQGYNTSNNYVSEEITLTGTTAIASSNTYKYIESVSKRATNGTITFRNSGSTTTYMTLSPKEKHSRILTIGLHPIPDKATTIYGRGYAAIPELVNEYDMPLGLTYDHLNAIILGSYARYLRYDTTSNREAIPGAFKAYYEEINKILSMENRDPDLFPRMKAAHERRVITWFRPLNKWSP